MRSLGVKAVISPCAAGSLQLRGQARRFRGVRPVRGSHQRPGRHLLRRPDRHPPLVGRRLRPGPARPGGRHHPRPRHRGPRRRHGRRHPGPALLLEGRVEVVQRRRLGGHQHDPVPRGVAVSRARDGGRQHRPDHRLRRGRHRGHRGGRRDERARGLPAERRADPGGRARPDRALPGRPRRAGGAGGAGTDAGRRPRDGARGHPAVRDRACDRFRPGSGERHVPGRACRSVSRSGRSGRNPAGGSRAPGGSTRRATPGSGHGTTSWARATRPSRSSSAGRRCRWRRPRPSGSRWGRSCSTC